MTPASDLTWFAQHEIRISGRETLAMMTGGRAGRARNITIALIAFAAFMHLPAYAVVGRFAEAASAADKSVFIVVTASIFLAWALVLSQAMELVTRVFYSRADLDLIMSSPVTLANVFSVRMAAIALSVTAMALLLSIPFIDILLIKGGLRWLTAFGVITAMGISAVAVALALTVTLFRMIGPKRTRLIAQILAVFIGAGFVIALQIAAILSYGTLSRFAVLTSSAAMMLAPGADSFLWWPARAVFGDAAALLALLGGSFILLGITMAILSPRLSEIVSAATDLPTARRDGHRGRVFLPASPQQALRRKEFVLLRRDPWLISQTLMQLLYLLPPVVMLWRSFGDSPGALIILTPVVVMAAGQLAGGLAWLTISGEDAPDLVATAPVSAPGLIRAKIEVVVIIIAAVFAPVVLPLLFVSPMQALVTGVGAAAAALAATAIQFWFRVQARRSQFRRRQTSSRIATFAEAFSSIGWAATAALTLLLPLAGAVTGLMTVLVLVAAWKFSPDRL